MANDVATPLPEMSLRDGTILTVTLDDAAARITRLVIHGWQEVDVVPAAGQKPGQIFLIPGPATV